LWLTAVLIALADGRLLIRGSSATVTVEGRSTPVPIGLTVGQALGRLGVPVAGDLLAVDHSVLRKGAHPPRVLVNGQPASATRRLGRGDRVAVCPGQNLMEPVARVPRSFRPANPAT
jgi:sulfur carrier protein ThiS